MMTNASHRDTASGGTFVWMQEPSSGFRSLGPHQEVDGRERHVTNLQTQTERTTLVILGNFVDSQGIA
jgi:hypothetical protein